MPHLIAWVETQGYDAAPIRTLRGMGELTDPDVRVPEASVEEAWELATTLTDRTLSVADIAFFLQYAEPAAFHRAFRRWMGQAPGDFRNAAG